MSNKLQLIIAALISLAGIALLFVGALLAPQGEIHESILVAFGEIGTFAGSIIGVDYHYRNKNNNNQNGNSTKPPQKIGQSRSGTNQPPLQPGQRA